jgi:cytochrome c oxidase subunit 2
VRVWVNVKQTLPEVSADGQNKVVDHVRIIAQQWAWSFQYPGPDGKFDTPDDVKNVDDLHVKVGTITQFELTSRDVLHSFSVPVFRLKQDAIPGRVVNGWFEAKNTGTYDIQCTEICGVAHGIMFARIIVETPAQRDLWIQQHVSPEALAAAAAAAPAPTAPPTTNPEPPKDAPNNQAAPTSPTPNNASPEPAAPANP